MSRNYFPPVLLGLVGIVGTLVLVAGYYGWWGNEPDALAGLPLIAPPDESYSNILPEDYVGPMTCGKCHANQFRRWSSHPHRFMNQMVSKAAVQGDFSNHVWQVREGVTVTFSTKEDDYLMTIDRVGRPRYQYRVTRTVGSRFMQFYIGVQVEGPESPADRVFTTEHKLPFGYWFRLKRWVPVNYFDVNEGQDETLKDGFPQHDGIDTVPSFLAFDRNCLHCHNTYAHAYRLFKPGLRGFPDASVQPEYGALAPLLSTRVPVEATATAFEDLPFRMDSHKDLVTVGISCESCHFGGREHAEKEKQIAFYPANPHLRVAASNPERPFTGERKNPATSQGVCSQCHSAIVPHYPNGASIRNSAEATDMHAGACASQIRCVTCHDPHTAGKPSGGPTLVEHLDACKSCHPQYTTPEAAAAHSRHGAASGVNCLDCHMPRINQGLDEIVRTHRITQPLEASMIAEGWPNACNLCHLDKSVRWSLDELKRGWGRELPLEKVAAGVDLEQPVGPLWLNGKRASTRMIATEAYARHPLGKADPNLVLRALNDPDATNRLFGVFATERLLGRPLAPTEMDVLGPPARRAQQIDVLRTSFSAK